MREEGSDVKRNEMLVKETSALRMKMGREEVILPTYLLILPSKESIMVVRLNVVDSDSCMCVDPLQPRWIESVLAGRYEWRDAKWMVRQGKSLHPQLSISSPITLYSLISSGMTYISEMELADGGKMKR